MQEDKATPHSCACKAGSKCSARRSPWMGCWGARPQRVSREEGYGKLSLVQNEFWWFSPTAKGGSCVNSSSQLPVYFSSSSVRCLMVPASKPLLWLALKTLYGKRGCWVAYSSRFLSLLGEPWLPVAEAAFWGSFSQGLHLCSGKIKQSPRKLSGRHV